MLSAVHGFGCCVLEELISLLDIDLKKAPFNLSVEDIGWVNKTRNGLSTEQKLRQLFVHISIGDDPREIRRLAGLQPGGFHRIMGPELDAAHGATRLAMELSEVPPFITADLEGGANHAGCMTPLQNQLGIAATNSFALSQRVVEVVATEASALGYNWTFTPCIDVNKEWASAIVGTRSYGSDVAMIARQAKVHMDVMQAHGIAATAKHWPGEGYDARDQHLVTTVNPLGLAEWEKVFGSLYRKLINDGILSVMSAHIALPDYVAAKGVGIGLERYRPASVSKLLNENLLRGELGFNGLIVSDATPMAGLGSFAARSVIAPEIIENGCDVFLFSGNEEQDLQFLRDGMRYKRLSEARLDAAITRILGMKAALGLHRKSIDQRILPLDQCRSLIKSDAHLAIARKVAEHSVTLVKDVPKLLPLSLSRHRRICVIGGIVPGFLPGAPERDLVVFRDGLTTRGFDVKSFDPNSPPTPDTVDLVIYALADESALGKSRIFLNWAKIQPGIKNIMTRYWHDIPTLLVSFGHAYYLHDAPRMPTVINAYSPVESVQNAVVERLTGNAPFTGVSPVDAFAGALDGQY